MNISCELEAKQDGEVSKYGETAKLAVVVLTVFVDNTKIQFEKLESLCPRCANEAVDYLHMSPGNI